MSNPTFKSTPELGLAISVARNIKFNKETAKAIFYTLLTTARDLLLQMFFYIVKCAEAGLMMVLYSVYGYVFKPWVDWAYRKCSGYSVKGLLYLLIRPFVIRLKLATIYLGLCASRGIILLLCCIPPLKSIIVEKYWKISRLDETSINRDETAAVLFTKKHIDSTFRTYSLDMAKSAKLGCNAIDVPIYKLDGKTKIKLLELMVVDRPLVVSFGNYTCPHFVSQLQNFRQVVVDFIGIVDFVIIYTEESHPEDGWALDGNNRIKQHKTLAERCAAAKQLALKKPPCPIYVDSMNNTALKTYGSPQERLYVIHKGKILYQGGLGPVHYDLGAVRDCLSNYLIHD